MHAATADLLSSYWSDATSGKPIATVKQQNIYRFIAVSAFAFSYSIQTCGSIAAEESEAVHMTMHRTDTRLR